MQHNARVSVITKSHHFVVPNIFFMNAATSDQGEIIKVITRWNVAEQKCKQYKYL